MYYILVLSLTPPGWEPDLKRDTSIAFAIDPLDTPDLSDNVFYFYSFLIYLVPQYLLILFYLNSVIFSPLFHIKVYAVRAFKLSYSFLLINVLRFIMVCSSFLTEF